MPKIWDATISGHREAVQSAILDGAANVIHDRGLSSVSMSDIARAAGISRATLYKYYDDLDAVLEAWHRRVVDSHIASLEAVAHQHSDIASRVHAVLREYAALAAHRPPGPVAAGLHSSPAMEDSSGRLHELFVRLLSEAADVSMVTRRLPSAELATYCEHALSAAAELPSLEAVDRLVELVLASLVPATDSELDVRSPPPADSSRGAAQHPMSGSHNPSAT